MKSEFALLVLFVAAACAYRSGFDCQTFCVLIWAPVCSTEGKTYPSECWLKCDWAFKACDGPCPCHKLPSYKSPPPPRPKRIYHEPVVSYEPPTYDCHCSPDKDYVCTLDNETYDNECEARCDGKIKACDGPCPCS